jgi:RND family efflux transporter MFP subunit
MKLSIEMLLTVFLCLLSNKLCTRIATLCASAMIKKSISVGETGMHFTKINQLKATIKAFVLFFMVTFCSLAQATQVKVDYVLPWDKGEQVLLYCTVDVSFKNQISSYAEAELTWALPEGSWVKKGDVLARQNSFYLDRQSKMLAIRIADANSKWDFTRKEYTRLQTLTKGHVAESQLNSVKRQYEEAKYALAEMEQQREVINYRLSKLEHLAPAKGQVSHLLANLGENMAIGQPILLLFATQFKELACSVPLNVYQKFNEHSSKKKLSVKYQFNESYSLSLKRQQASAQKDEQSLRVFLSLPAQLQASLVVGQRLQITMYQQQPNLTQVPFDAMILANEGNYVWRLDEDNKVHKQLVDIVAAQKVSFIVRSKMKSGSRVVVRGKQSVTAGKYVYVVGEQL